MTSTRAQRDDPLTDFTRRPVDIDGVAKTVYVAGRGAAVVLMPEMPGISPDVARFARWIRDAGLSVYVPSLFGVDGAWPTAEDGEAIVRRACVSTEFRASPAAAPVRSRLGCAGWPGSRMLSVVGRASELSASVSPATSPSRWPSNLR